MPLPFRSLAKVITLRRGQTSVIGAAPGVAKTAFTLNIIAKTDTPTLYLSPDSDIMTIAPRLVSILHKRTLSNVLRAFDDNGAEKAQYMEELGVLSHVEFSFMSAPTFGDIKDEIKRYEWKYGVFPELIILDNIRNVYNSEGSDGVEHTRHGATVDFFKNGIAPMTGAHCMLLHHVMGPFEDGNTPPPLSALLGKLGKEPRVVLNLFRETESQLGAVVAKNSNGRAYPDASKWETLSWDGAKQLID